MNTERDIIYTMLDTLRAGEVNNDERLGERYLRNLLRKYRANSLRKHYFGGPRVNPEIFQEFPIILDYESDLVYTYTLPKIIRFKHEEGYYLNINGYQIPIVTPQDYYFSLKNWNSKFLPIGKTTGQKLTVFIGDDSNECVASGSDTETAILAMKNTISTSTGQAGKLVLTFGGVLQDPDDDPNYNSDTSVYPFPAERIEELTNQIMIREFGITRKAKPDEVQNARPDSIRYHDQDDVTQN